MKKTLTALMLTLGITIFNQAPTWGAGNLWERKMGEIINCYLKIRSQLAADSLDGVSSEAWKIAKAAETVREVLDSAGHDARLHQFHTQVDIKAITQQANMLYGQDIQAVREHLKLLSEPLKKYIELFGKPENVTGELYIYHCPMYPGYWLQENNNVGNPYYGKKMLKCGSLATKSGAK